MLTEYIFIMVFVINTYGFPELFYTEPRTWEVL